MPHDRGYITYSSNLKCIECWQRVTERIPRTGTTAMIHVVTRKIADYILLINYELIIVAQM